MRLAPSVMLRASVRCRRGHFRGSGGWRRRAPRGTDRRTVARRACRPRAARTPACPLSGLTQTTAKAWRASRSISRPASSASPRSQPSRDDDDDRAARQRAAAPLVVVGLQRRADARAARPVLHARRPRPRTPSPDCGRRAPASAWSAACRTRTSRRRVPIRAPRAGRAAAPARTPPSIRRRRGSARACVARPCGCGTCARRDRRRCASDARTSPRTSSARPLESGRSRRVRRCGRATAIAWISFRARANSSGVIAAKSFVRRSSSSLQVPSLVSPPSTSGPGPGGAPLRRSPRERRRRLLRGRRLPRRRRGTRRGTRDRRPRRPRAARRASAAASSRRPPAAPARPRRDPAARPALVPARPRARPRAAPGRR